MLRSLLLHRAQLHAPCLACRPAWCTSAQLHARHPISSHSCAQHTAPQRYSPPACPPP